MKKNILNYIKKNKILIIIISIGLRLLLCNVILTKGDINMLIIPIIFLIYRIIFKNKYTKKDRLS
jgi:fucose permease